MNCDKKTLLRALTFTVKEFGCLNEFFRQGPHSACRVIYFFNKKINIEFSTMPLSHVTKLMSWVDGYYFIIKDKKPMKLI